MRGETKEQRFKRVGEKRVQNTIDSLRKMSQCSNKRMYEWSDEQTKKIWDALYNEVKKCKASFEKVDSEEFRL